MLQAGVFAVLFMIELKNLTNVVIGKLGKLVHKQKCSRDFFLFFYFFFLFFFFFQLKSLFEIFTFVS